MFARLLVCALLLGTFGVASPQDNPAPAQQQPAAQQLDAGTTRRNAEVQKQNQALVQYAGTIVAMIDNGQARQVWD